MSIQRTNTKWALALVAVIAAMGMLAEGEAEEQADWLTRYCTDAAIWQAEEARGVPLNQRTGQPDYKGIAEESCPGMRPAPASVQLVQF